MWLTTEQMLQDGSASLSVGQGDVDPGCTATFVDAQYY